MINISLTDIVKIQYLYLDIFEEEDDDFPDYRKIILREKAIEKILSKITDNTEEKNEIYETIIRECFVENNTFKPTCNNLRELGYKII